MHLYCTCSFIKKHNCSHWPIFLTDRKFSLFLFWPFVQTDLSPGYYSNACGQEMFQMAWSLVTTDDVTQQWRWPHFWRGKQSWWGLIWHAIFGPIVSCDMVLLEHCISVRETGKDILFLIQLKNDADLWVFIENMTFQKRKKNWSIPSEIWGSEVRA